MLPDPSSGIKGPELAESLRGCDYKAIRSLGLSTLAQKTFTFSIIVGLYKPHKVKGYLLSNQAVSNP